MADNLGSLGDAYVTIRADLAALKTEVAGIGAAVAKQAGAAGAQAGKTFSTSFAKEAAKIGSIAKDAGASMSEVGRGLTAGLTVPLVGLGVVAAKAAIDFESAFAGVRKTVDATEPQFAAMSAGIRAMSQEIPVTAVELSKLAAIGGQFGVSSENILGFTRTIAELDVAVDGISGEEAAAGLVQFGKVAGVADADLGRLASTLVDLGNKGNSTESVILDFAKRLAPAGASIGLTASQTMGLGAAMANLGINAEAGGTAMSRVMSKMEAAVARGGEGLAQFAEVAGMLPEQFAKTFEEAPIEAINAFVTGLGKAKDEGKALTLVLDEVDMTDARLVSTLKGLAQSQGEVSKQVNIANEAYKAGNLHTKEAEERFKTAESQIKLFMNRLTEVATVLGGALVPVLLDVLDAAEPVIDIIEVGAKAFAELPAPLKMMAVGAAAGAAALGPLLLVAGQVASVFGAIVSAGAMPMVAGFIGQIGRAALAATPALGGIAIAVASVAAIGKAGSEAWGLYKDRQEQAALATAQNQSHQVAMGMASKIAGREITDLNEALRILREKAAASKAEQAALAQTQTSQVAPAAQTATQKLAALRAEVAKLPEDTKANIRANLEMGLSVKETAEAMKLGEGVVKLYADGLKTTTKQADESAEALKRLKATLTGEDDLKAANQLVAVINEIGGATKLTKDEAKQYAEQLADANEKALAMGKTASPAFLDMMIRLDGIATSATDAAVGMDLLADNVDKVTLKAPALASMKIDPAKFLEPFKTLGKDVGNGNIVPGLGSKIVADIGATVRDQLGPTIVSAFAGGGSPLKAGGALLGNALGESVAEHAGKALTGALGKSLGGVVGGALGPLGSMLGGFIGGKLQGVFGGLFGGVSKDVKEARGAVADFEAKIAGSLTTTQKAEAGGEKWKMTVIGIRDAYLATGRTAAEADAAARMLWESSKKGPEASARAIAEVNAVLDEAKTKTTALGEEGDTTFADMGAAAQKFGIDMAGLGQAFQQHNLSGQFNEALAALRLFEKGGADMGVVLTGMSDEISGMVQDSLKFGTEIPAAMRPYLESLVASGQLLDENGNKMTSLEGLTFAETLTQGVDRMVAAVEKLGEALTGIGSDAQGTTGKVDGLNRALTNLPRDISIDIEADYSSTGDVPGFAGGTLGETGGWFGSFGSGTLAMLHGDEAVIRPDQAMSFALDQLGILTAPDGMQPEAAEGVDSAAARERMLFSDVNDRLDKVAATIAAQQSTMPEMMALALRDALRGGI